MCRKMCAEKSSPSQALPRQLPQGGSQDLRSVAKVLGVMRKCPAVLLALPLGELSPQVTERAHAVCPVTKVLGTMSKFPAALLPLPLGEVASPQAMTERAHAVCPVTKASGAIRNFPAVHKSSPFGGAGRDQRERTERVQAPPWGSWRAKRD